jgi:chromate transporter
LNDRSVKHTFQVFLVALRLGLISFGGPIAHIGYFREEYVARRKWLDERSYLDVVALCQFLPGPASSQVGIIVGMMRAGLPGGLAAWLGFTLPSAVALTLFALGVAAWDVGDAGWLRGLKIAAVVVVAQAVWSMSRSFAPDKWRATIAVVAAVAALVYPTAWTQLLIIAAAGIIGWRWLKPEVSAGQPAGLSAGIPRWLAIVSLAAFALLLAALPLLRQVHPAHWLAMFDSFFRSGALVFGGGHVVLPLLQAEVVPPGWIDQPGFLAGYGAAQAVPGPLFTFSAYLGAASGPSPNGVGGAALALAAIFLPAFLLVVGVLPFWDALRTRPGFQSALLGINAGVVGILLAALYNPVWTGAVKTPADVALAAAALALLTLWRAPPWVVVLFCAGGGMGIALLSQSEAPWLSIVGVF